MLTLFTGDWIEQLREGPEASAQTCVTSPPYWGLRDYGVAGQLGLEKTPEEYVSKLVAGFREVRRVLANTGTLWVNLGDSYNASGGARCGGGSGPSSSKQVTNGGVYFNNSNPRKVNSCKAKDLIGIPWMVAFALRNDGWYLRSDIIWAKPNPMPESVTDRPTRSHEYIFLLTKSARYYYNAGAIKEPAESNRPDMATKGVRTGLAYLQQGPMASNHQKGRTGKTAMRGQGHFRNGDGPTNREGRDMSDVDANANGTRNKRDVWFISTNPYREAHFATFPPDLIKPCILAGSRPGDTVLDPFAGSGTTGQVALELGRKATLIELNPDYCELIRQRCNVTAGLPL